MKSSYNVSLSLEMPPYHQQPQPLIKSALKKITKDPRHPNKIESSMANASNTKMVQFTCSTKVAETAKDSYEFERSLDATTTPSSRRRNIVSSGPTPSRFDYSLSSITPTNAMTDDKVATAVTPNSSGNSRQAKENQISRSQLRLSAVRAHGGRMGLQEKLRQVRRKRNVDETTSIFSPPLERKVKPLSYHRTVQIPQSK